MARPKKFETIEEFSAHIIKFCEKCDETGENPSDWALCRYLNIGIATLDRYKAGESAGEGYKGYDAEYKKLIAYREHRLVSLMERDPKQSTAAIFQLKQKKNGGYTDHEAINDPGAVVTLKIEGVGGVEAFK